MLAYLGLNLLLLLNVYARDTENTGILLDGRS